MTALRHIASFRCTAVFWFRGVTPSGHSIASSRCRVASFPAVVSLCRGHGGIATRVRDRGRAGGGGDDGTRRLVPAGRGGVRPRRQLRPGGTGRDSPRSRALPGREPPRAALGGSGAARTLSFWRAPPSSSLAFPSLPLPPVGNWHPRVVRFVLASLRRQQGLSCQGFIPGGYFVMHA